MVSDRYTPAIEAETSAGRKQCGEMLGEVAGQWRAIHKIPNYAKCDVLACWGGGT